MESMAIGLPFEFCALQFLLQWERQERSIHTYMKGETTPEQLRQALRYFQVARNFIGLSGDDCSKKILRLLNLVICRTDLSSETKVLTLAADCKKSGFQYNLSAASKLLWLSLRHPFVIYDSRAFAALRVNFDFSGDARDYVGYCHAWRVAYNLNKKNIKKAANQLPKTKNFMPFRKVADQQFLKMVNEPWFLGRVFDRYLWELGGDI